jgi:translation initiation factor IF-2
MSETDNKPTLGRKPLGLKTSVEAGEVKQTFSHGRTNKVVVEVKRRKLIGKPGSAEAAAAAPEPAPACAGVLRRRPSRAAPSCSAPAKPRRNALPACSARPRKPGWPRSRKRPAAKPKHAQRAIEEERRRAEESRKAEAPAPAADLQPVPAAPDEAPVADAPARKPAEEAAPLSRRSCSAPVHPGGRAQAPRTRPRRSSTRATRRAIAAAMLAS